MNYNINLALVCDEYTTHLTIKSHRTASHIMSLAYIEQVKQRKKTVGTQLPVLRFISAFVIN